MSWFREAWQNIRCSFALNPLERSLLNLLSLNNALQCVSPLKLGNSSYNHSKNTVFLPQIFLLISNASFLLNGSGIQLLFPLLNRHPEESSNQPSPGFQSRPPLNSSNRCVYLDHHERPLDLGGWIPPIFPASTHRTLEWTNTEIQPNFAIQASRQQVGDIFLDTSLHGSQH